jgi:hypothetical protein
MTTVKNILGLCREIQNRTERTTRLKDGLSKGRRLQGFDSDDDMREMMGPARRLFGKRVTEGEN